MDTSRTGLVGRLYGGYMTLTLAGRHPDLSAKGKEVESLVLEDEGRDVLKYVDALAFITLSWPSLSDTFRKTEADRISGSKPLLRKQE